MTTNSFKRQLSTKPEQSRPFEAHLEARKEYVNALDARFVPDMPAREVRALSSRITRLLHPVVRKAPTSPCPNLATLKLDQALKDGQWILIRTSPAKRDGVKVTLRTLLPRGSVITSPLYIPRSVSEGADDIWLCPYFDPETLTLRFLKPSGDDSTVMIPLKRLLMSECGRSLAELAYAEGLIPSAIYTSALSEVQETQAVDEAIPQGQEISKVSEATSEDPESEPSFRHWRHRPNTCEAIKTLHRSEAVAQQQVLCFDEKLTRTTRQIIVDEEPAGQVGFSFPRRLLPKDGSAFYCCPYFDPELEELRYCTPEGEDIPGISVSIMEMTRSKDLRSALVLAKSEGMIHKVPGVSESRKAAQACPVLLTLHHPFGDGYVTSLQLEEALASGYVIELQLPAVIRAYITLSLHLGPNSGIALFTREVEPDPDRTLLKLVPYVHESGNLRLWDKERSQDWKSEPGEIFEISPHVVKNISPILFKMGDREDLWTPSGRRNKIRVRDVLGAIVDFLELVLDIRDIGNRFNSKV